MKHIAVVVALASLGMHCERRPTPRVSNVPIATAAQPICGDGIVTADEQCDDGNVTAGDGCHACKLETPQCGPGTDGVVWRWQCAGSPSRCTLAACTSSGAGADCSADLATRKLTARVRLDGFVDAARADASRVTGGGLACTCRDTLGGLVCDPGCTHEVATCARTTPTATSSTAQFSRWSWACSGTGASCTVQPDADTTIDATFTAAPIAVAGAAVLPTVWGMRVLAVDDSGAILVTGRAAGRVGQIALSDLGDRTFAAVITRAGVVRAAVDLGVYDHDVVRGGVFADDGFWLVVSHVEDPYHHAEDNTTLHTLRFDRRGVRVVSNKLGHIDSTLAIAPRPDGGVALAVGTLRQDKREWVYDGFAMLVYDRAGALAWRRTEAKTVTVFPTAIRAIGSDLLLAGLYRTSDAHTGTLVTQPPTSRMHRLVLRFDERGRASTPYVIPANDHDEFAGSAFAPDGSLISLYTGTGDQEHLAVLERRDPAGHVVWTQAIGTRDVVTPYLDPRTLAVSSSGDRIAFLVGERVDTPDGSHARVVVRVVDGNGTYLHAWSFAVAAPATFGAGLAGMAGDQAVLGGEVTGPLTLGHVRFAASTRVSAALWLDPHPHPGVAH